MNRPVIHGMGFFTLVWAGELISVIGSGMNSFALGIVLFQQTGSVTLYSLIAVSMAVPTVLLAPLSGAVADRYDRRLVLVVSNLVSAFGTLLLFYLASRGDLVPWHIYPIVAFKTAASVFIWTSFSAATTLIVDRRDYARASGMVQMAVAGGQILAPPIGGALLGLVGLEGILMIDMATFLVPTLVLLALRFPQPSGVAGGDGVAGSDGDSGSAGETDGDAGERGSAAPGIPAPGAAREPGALAVGWTFIRRHPGLWWLLLLFAGLNFCLGTVEVLITPLVLNIASPAVLGIVLGLAGCGMLVGSLLMSVWGGPEAGRRVVPVLAVMFGLGALVTVAGWMLNVAMLGAAAFFYMAGVPIVAGTSQAIWQVKVPPEIQGRVFAVRQLVAQSALPLSFALAGPLADHVFEPLLLAGGPLAGSLGQIFGVGPGRGTGLLLSVYGMAVMLLVAAASRSRSLLRVEEDVPDAVGASETPRPERRRDETAEGLARLGRPAAASLLAALVAAVPLVLVTQRPPDLTTSPALLGFSLERVERDLESFAQKPRPSGSPAHREVRGEIVRRLRDLGLETDVQSTVGVATDRRLIKVAAVENVVGRLAGKASAEPRRALLMMAHYDSVASSAGAADNAAAVAVLLETARLLAAGPAFLNDVIFLFSDGEEVGLVGARAFVQEHPWARQVAMVVNFDARGNGGPVYMFETGARGDRWTPRLLAGSPWPIGNSFMQEIYARMANETDFTIFRETGHPGVNLAFIEGLTHYHSALDRPQDVSRRSLEHQASYALGLARHFGSSDLEPEPSGDGAGLVYFNLAGPFMVHYGAGFAMASAVLVVILTLAILVAGWRRGRLSASGVVGGFFAFLVMVLAIPVALTLLWLVARDFLGVPVIGGGTPGAGLFMTAFAVLAVALYGAVYLFFRRHTLSLLDFWAGALLWWVILVIAASGTWLEVESNYLFVWPLFLALAGFGHLCVAAPDSLVRPRNAAILLAAALPAILLVAPQIVVFYLGLMGIFELGGGALVLEILLLGLLMPQFEVAARRWPRLTLALPAGLGMLLLALAIFLSPRDLRQNSVLYAHDADRGESSWYSFERGVGDWLGQFGFEAGVTGEFDRFFPLVGRPILISEAPPAALPAPRIEVVDERILDADLREIRLLWQHPAGSRVRAFWIEPFEAVTGLRVAGKGIPLGSAEGGFPFIERIGPASSEEIVLRLRGDAVWTFHAVEQHDGLPVALEARPSRTLPRAGFTSLIRSDVTLVRKSVSAPTATNRVPPE